MTNLAIEQRPNVERNFLEIEMTCRDHNHRSKLKYPYNETHTMLLVGSALRSGNVTNTPNFNKIKAWPRPQNKLFYNLCSENYSGKIIARPGIDTPTEDQFIDNQRVIELVILFFLIVFMAPWRN